MDDQLLKTLSSQELLKLKDTIETAIRAAIRQKNQARFVPASANPVSQPRIDLARERDAWMAARAKPKAL